MWMVYIQRRPGCGFQLPNTASSSRIFPFDPSARDQLPIVPSLWGPFSMFVIYSMSLEKLKGARSSWGVVSGFHWYHFRTCHVREQPSPSYLHTIQQGLVAFNKNPTFQHSLCPRPWHLCQCQFDKGILGVGNATARGKCWILVSILQVNEASLWYEVALMIRYGVTAGPIIHNVIHWPD